MRKPFLLILLLCRPLFAVQEYYSLTRNVRALGMGGAFYALSDDEYALFYNPASLDLYHGRPRVTLINFGLMASSAAVSDMSPVINGAINHNDLQSVVAPIASDQNTPLSIAGGLFPYFVKKKFAMGLLIGDSKVNAALYGAGPLTTFDVTAISDTGIFLAWSSKFRKHWHLGVTTKAVYRIGGHNVYTTEDILAQKPYSLSTFQDGGAGLVVDADFGAIYEITDPWIGSEAGMSFVLSNLLGTYLISHGNEPPALTRTVSAGLYVVFDGHKLAESYTLRIDAAEFSLGGYHNDDLGARGGSPFKHLNAGLEMKLSSLFFLRGGVHQGDWTAGFGFQLPGIHLDFATYGEELMGIPGALTSRRFALQLSLGFEMAGNRALFLNPD